MIDKVKVVNKMSTRGGATLRIKLLSYKEIEE